MSVSFKQREGRIQVVGMTPIILLPDPQMKGRRLSGLHRAFVPWFCGQFRFCGRGRNVFRGCEKYIETVFARFQNAYHRYRGDGLSFPDRCRSQHRAPSGDRIPSRTIPFYNYHAKVPTYSSAKKSCYSKRLRNMKRIIISR